MKKKIIDLSAALMHRTAFSLIELLVSLIIISLIAASFAPVLTKKIKNKNLTLSQATKITNKCSNSDCLVCDKKNGEEECLFCMGNCSSGYKYNTKTCKCEKVDCPKNTFLDGSNCSPCTNRLEHCSRCNFKECLECEEGYKLRDNLCRKILTPQSQSDCDKFDAVFISFKPPKESTPGVCMSKLNLYASSKVNFFATPRYEGKNGTSKYTACPEDKTSSCCWYGGGLTASSDTCTGAAGAAHSNYYSSGSESCKRAVCNYAAAKAICSTHHYGNTIEGDWELPNSNLAAYMDAYVNGIEPCYSVSSYHKFCYGPKFDENSSISYIQKFKGSMGLDLCIGSSFGAKQEGSPTCYMRKNACMGSTLVDHEKSKNVCAPSAFWTDDKGAISYTRAGFFYDKTRIYLSSTSESVHRYGTYDEGSAFSVRCVLTSFLEY